MRPSRRLHLQFQATLLAICFVVCPRAVLAQNSAQLPPQWNDAVVQLADKIAANVSPLHPLSLETKNISGLSPVETANLRGTLESELKNRSFHLVSADSTPATAQSVAIVQFTISEAAAGYVLVAEIQNASEPDTKPQVAIVAAPKTAPGTDQQPIDSLSLDKRLIWQQPARFLDFALQTGPPQFYSTLVILEPDRLVSYHSSGSQWQVWQTISIPRPKPWPRDLHGTINVEGKSVSLSGVECVGDVFDLPKVKCAPLHLLKDSLPVDIPGREGNLYVQLFARCGSASVVLASGTGDWTQPDSIEGYLHAEANRPAIPSGTPMDLDGPVMALWAESRESAARAIVRSLKTGNYEGYIVTATCSH
jgi:hypothetical protein